MDIISKSLFLTESVKVADPDKPFWYTSGTLGPFFINTHFLFGGEKKANELLDFINISMNDMPNFIIELEKKILDFYKNNDLFKAVINEFYSKLVQHKKFGECSYISGGERRDWFFSFIAAYLSGKKALYICKDIRVYSSGGSMIKDIKNAGVCHICDLITHASSFKRAWIPAVNNLNGKLLLTASVVDRNQGGIEFLNENNIDAFACVIINGKFFDSALNNGIINEKQLKLINDFKNDPDNFGRNFIINNPEFLINSVQNPSSKSKALTCIRDNPYKLDFKTLAHGKLLQYV